MESKRISKLVAEVPTVEIKETQEFVDALFDTLAEGIRSFGDGAQVTDIFNFTDEAVKWKPAIEGFAENFRKEAVQSMPPVIEKLFNPQYDKLIAVGVKPMLAYTITNAGKSVFSAYALAAAGGQELVEAQA